MAELSTGSPSRSGTQAFPADPRDLYRVRRLIRQEAEQALLPGETIDDLVIAVSEACANAALHSSSSEITLRWDMSQGRIEIRVEDKGVFDKRIPTGLDGSEGGRGIPVMMALMDELSIREGRSSSTPPDSFTIALSPTRHMPFPPRKTSGTLGIVCQNPGVLLSSGCATERPAGARGAPRTRGSAERRAGWRPCSHRRSARPPVPRAARSARRPGRW